MGKEQTNQAEVRIDPDGTVWKVKYLPGPDEDHPRRGVRRGQHLPSGSLRKSSSGVKSTTSPIPSDLRIMGFSAEDVGLETAVIPPKIYSTPKQPVVRKPRQNEKT
jgi:hypothetical protein